MKQRSTKLTKTREELREAYSAVEARRMHKRSTQTTILLSRLTLQGIPSLQQARAFAEECRGVAKKYTRQSPRLLSLKVSPHTVSVHVTQPQLAIHLGDHFAKSYKKIKPQVEKKWSRDQINRMVEVTVNFSSPTSEVPGRSKTKLKKTNIGELHKWAEWYAWQDKQQQKQKKA